MKFFEHLKRKNCPYSQISIHRPRKGWSLFRVNPRVKRYTSDRSVRIHHTRHHRANFVGGSRHGVGLVSLHSLRNIGGSRLDGINGLSSHGRSSIICRLLLLEIGCVCGRRGRNRLSQIDSDSGAGRTWIHWSSNGNLRILIIRAKGLRLG